MLKATKEKWQITYKGTPIRFSTDFSTETLQARKEWDDIFKVMKGKNLQPRLVYPAKLCSNLMEKSKALQTKTIKKMVIGSYILIITLNVNGLNAPTKRHTLARQMKTSACMYFHLHHCAWPPPNCMEPFYIVKLIMFPIWLKIIIIFYFLSGYWLGKLINTLYYGDYVTITHFIPLYHDWSTEN